MRIGIGYDIHKLKRGLPLVIGGINIPHTRGCVAHSDGDVLIHAIIDSILGAAGLEDIGTYFPPSDPQWKNISSLILLKKTMELIAKENLKVMQVDSVVILEKPKLLPFKKEIRTKMSQALNLEYINFNIKGKTKERCDSTGKNRAIEAMATTTLSDKQKTRTD